MKVEQPERPDPDDAAGAVEDLELDEEKEAGIRGGMTKQEFIKQTADRSGLTER